MIKINDPLIYPINFTIKRFNVDILDNKTATTIFKSQDDYILKNCYYFYNNKFYLDIDIANQDDLYFIKDNKKCIYEFICDSTDLSTCNFNMRVWKDDTSFKVYNSNSFLNLKQNRWNFSDTTSFFSVSNSYKRFSAIEIDSIPYYPLVYVDVVPNLKYRNLYTLAQFEILPGQSISKDIIDKDNFGILNFTFTLKIKWYYDESRTIEEISPPEGLTFQEKTFSSRMIIPEPSCFIKAGYSDGDISIFSRIYTQDYIISSGYNYGSLYFNRQKVSDGIGSFSFENEVIIDENGYCNKPGFESSVYILE